MKKVFLWTSIIVILVAIYQLPSVNNALYLFIVLGLNPITNQAIPLMALVILLIIAAIISGMLIFSTELNKLFDGVIEFALNPGKSGNQVNSVSLSNDQPADAIVTPLSLELLVHEYQPNYIGSDNVKHHNEAPKIESENSHSTILKTLKHLFQPVLLILIGCVILFAKIELICWRVVNKVSSSIYRLIVSSSKFVINVVRQIILGAMAIAGYTLLLFISLIFLLWRLSEPYILRADRWVTRKLQNDDEFANMVKIMTEMSSTISTWYRGLRGIN